MGEIYTSAQAAEKLGVSVSTIHTWKRRNLNKFQEGAHWVKQNDALFWTEQGIQLLSGLKEGVESEPHSVECRSHSKVNANDIQDLQEPSPLESRYLPLVDMLADALTPRLQRRLDERVQRNLATNNAPPMTTIECVAVLSELGLKPADPAALLGANIAGLIAGNDQQEAGTND